MLLLIGAIYYQLGNYRQCIAFNDRCIMLDPHMAEAHANLANALQQISNFDLAMIYYQVRPRQALHACEIMCRQTACFTAANWHEGLLDTAAVTLRPTKTALCIEAAHWLVLLLQTGPGSPQQECLPSCHICTSTSEAAAQHVASSPRDGVWGICSQRCA